MLPSFKYRQKKSRTATF